MLGGWRRESKKSPKPGILDFISSLRWKTPLVFRITMSVKLGHFELLEQIGKGGMAAVFKAYDPSLNRTVAIKLLDEELAQQDPQFVETFIHEAQTAAAINHPNIVQIYFVGEEKGNFYIAMELLEGRSLDEIIKDEGPQSEATILKIGIQVASALSAAYANQMIHGDIKPQNIFITNNGIAKLLDFGLAKMANIESATESDGSVWGSAYYISPERVGHKAEDFRSDIYSLGATLFHALVGHPPFDADTPEELAAKRLSEKAPTLRRINPDISAKTEQIIARMLNKSTFLRHLDYDSLVKDLREAEIKLDEKSRTSSLPLQQQSPVTAEIAAQNRAQTGNLARLAGTGNIKPVAPPIQPSPVQGARNTGTRRSAPLVVPKKNSMPLILGCSAGAVLLIGLIVLIVQLSKKQEPVQQTASSPVPAATVSATPTQSATVTNIPTDMVSVPFRYENPSAKTVQLAGSFNNWSPESMSKTGGVWVLRKNLKYLESYDYQFVVDGKAIPDPKRTRTRPDGRGGEASVFTVSIRKYPD